MRFPIERYASLVARLDDEGIDYDAFRSDPLGSSALRCLRYMHDVEHHTVCYLRDLLVTRAHRDPELTTFLTCWAYEEMWHGEAIGKVLAAHGEPAGAPRIAATRRRRTIADHAQPALMHVASMATPHITAVHMTWGALNEMTTQAGYGLLARRCDHPTLSELLRRIMKQEGRHIDVYAAQATERLAASRRARQLTRTALRRWWRPVGSGLMPATEVDHLVGWLFGGDDGAEAAARIDRRIDRLPGLAGLQLVTTARARHGAALAAA